VLYVALDNLSGNAIAFGRYLTQATGHDPDDKGLVIGLAIAAMTLSCLLHAVWRKGGILLNNAFAVMKVAILLMIIILGIVKLVHPPSVNPENFDIKTSFSGPPLGLSSYATSMLYAYYPYTGFVQPLYVLAEVRNPRGRFTKATIGTMVAIFIMYLLVNIAFFAVLPKSLIMSPDSDIALLFFQSIFENKAATQVMAAFIAINILGNIIVMIFVAARVKQEIAKEGVLPFSRFFASNSTTLFAKLGDTLSPKKVDRDRDELEQSPVAALFLHWLVSIIMIAVAAGVADGTQVANSTKVAYDVLVDLYTYVIALLVSFFVSIGLLYLMFHDRRAWAEMCGFHPWGGPSAAILVALSTGFLIVTAFLTPGTGSPYADAIEGFEWFIPPAVGLGTLLIGVVYWIVFRFVVPAVKGKQLVVDRVPIIVSDDHGGWVQKLEIVEFSWGVMHERINEDDDSGVDK
jgi:amino acid transporter